MDHQTQYPPLAAPLADGPFLPAWQPQVVDQPPRPRPSLPAAVVATAIATFVVAPGALEARAQATYPDQIHRPALHASQQQALALHPDPISGAADVPELSWAPSFPDRDRRRLHHPAHRELSVGPVAPRDFAVPGVWAPTFPDRIPARPGLPTAQQAASGALDPFPRVAMADADLSWIPIAPDTLPIRPAAVRARAYLYTVVEVAPFAPAYPVGELHWHSDYPETVPGRPYPTALRSGWVGPIEPIAAVSVAELSWLSAFPDRLDRLPHIRGLLPVLVQPIDPIATPAFVPLSWAPAYPSILARRLVHASRLPSVAEPPLGETATVVNGPWRPTFPVFLPRPARVVEFPGGRSFLVPLPVLADEVGCILLSDVRVLQGQLQALTVTQAQLHLALVIDETDTPVDVC